MEVKDVLHMAAGDGETSYASNSGVQKAVLSKTWPVLDDTFKQMFIENNNGFPKCIRLADLGCSSGPNTLFLISHVMDTIQHLCQNDNFSTDLPQLEVLLNDLPQSDFNNLFKLVSKFSATEKKSQCFIYGAPGSFYGSLFPSNSLHFVYSSSSIHWLSQVPEGMGTNNKENICIGTNSPPEVCEAYANQFRMDFSNFLSLRAEELTSGGRMVLAFLGRSVTVDPSARDELQVYTMLGEALFDHMVAQGLVRKDDLYSFYMPIYVPCLQEVETIIRDEGSFNLDVTDAVSVTWAGLEDYNGSVSDIKEKAELAASCIRAVTEPMLVAHFGSSIDVDGVFDIYVEKMTEQLSREEERCNYLTLVISSTRKPRT